MIIRLIVAFRKMWNLGVGTLWGDMGETKGLNDYKKSVFFCLNQADFIL